MRELTGYAKIISEATGVTAPERLEEIEDVMRHDIFHANLEHQGQDQLVSAARLAVRMLDGTYKGMDVVDQGNHR